MFGQIDDRDRGWPAEGASPRPPQSRQPQPADIAIVGISTLLPGAATLAQYWENILDKVDAIREVPADRWPAAAYFDETRGADDRITSKWGGFLDDVLFDPTRYGIPPSSVPAIDPAQLLALVAAEAAFADAGLAEMPAALRQRTAVILGFTGGLGELGLQYAARAELGRTGTASQAMLDHLPRWTSDSFAGLLPNVVAGRIASRFDLGGASFVVDAACATSLAALRQGVLELESGRSDLVLCGAVEAAQGPFAFTCFSKSQALSPNGRCRAFDSAADGTAIAEGIVMLVLRRLGEAQAAGDRIYAVIKGIDGSSDGRGRSMMAPLPDGQKRAARRAYDHAGYSSASVELFEAHGTGTVSGDAAELESLSTLLREDKAPARSCVVGSVKSLIGHAEGAAGFAGLVKAALALSHHVLPPHAGVETPNAGLSAPDSPLALLTAARPWLPRPGVPRRAGISAFGFGGANYHVTLEEAPQRAAAPVRATWPAELFVWRAADRAALLAALTAELPLATDAAVQPLASIARSVCARLGEGPATLALVATSHKELADLLQASVDRLKTGDHGPWPRGLYFSDAPLAADGRIAMLFPGQGSQYPDMGRELAALFPEMRAALEEADAILAESPTYRERPDPRLTRLIYPYARFAPAEEAMARQALAQTDVAQPALGAVELGCLALLARLGLKPAVVAGHSYGEFVALQAAGAISRRDLLRVSEARGRFIVTATRGQDLGTMAAVSASAASVRDALGDRPDITIANLNAPDQTVISGSKAAIALAVERLADLSATPVPVAAAFHSPLVAPAQDRLAAFLSDMAFERPQIPVYANTTGRAHMQDPAAIRAQMAAHLTAPVDFIGMIETMYADGARVFLEVGPKTVLSSLTRRILGDRPHIAIAMDGAGGGLVSLLHALAALIVQGAPVELAGLFAGRNLTNPPKAVAKKPGLAWQLNGSRAQPPAGTVPTTTPDAAASVPPNPTQARPAQARKEPAMNVYQAPVDLDGRDEPEASGIDRVLADHHRTMKQFLQMQERLMLAYLNGGSAPASERPRPFSTPRAAALPRRIIASPQMMQAPPPAPPPLAKAASPSQPPASTPTGSPGSSGSAAHAKSSDTKSPDPKGLDQKSLLLTIASEKTGYPVDMLDPTLNMEADLGIDSIKRVEILGAFRKAHPPAVAEYLSPRMTAIAKATTLQEVLVRVAAALAEEGAPRPFDDAGPGPCSLLTRYVMRAERELLPEMPTAVPSGQYIIVPDSQGFAEVLARRLAAAGATPRILPPNCLATDDQIVAWLGEARANGPLQGLVALSALDTPADWPNGMETSIKSLFALLRLAAPELSTGRILFASAMGGTFARDALTRDRTATVFPGAGGGVGLMKTLAVEWPAAICKAVDLDPEQPHDAKADALFTELALPFGRHEVGYSGGQRTIFRTVEAPLAPSPLAATPDGSWVVLAVGGARGITAETLRPFAAAGATCVILGRSALPDAESQTTMSLADGDALRAHFLVEARASGTRVTPAQIQAKIAAFLRDREIRANMADFAALGARIDYRICDVNDAAAVGSLLDVIYASYGRVDAVLFGAGLIEDRLVVDKTRDSLARVFDTKVLGAYHLIERLRPDTLKFLALFSSVAGRYGNRGQGDYAAANEVLNRYAWCLQKRYGRSVKVVAANWGAWESTTRGPGMLTPETARQFRARGLRLITPEEGREALWREYVFGPRDEVEVIFGEHPWEAQEAAAAEQDRRHTERATT